MKPAVPLHDVLLRIHRDTRERSRGPYCYIGPAEVGRLACFVLGYLEGLRALGVDEGGDALFGEWLRDVRHEWPEAGWDAGYLEEFSGDHERALRKYLELVAEFHALPPEALSAIPWHGPGAHPASRTPMLTPSRPPASTLDFLRTLHREVGDTPGRLGLFIGPIEVKRMAGLIDGYRLCLALAGARDEEYARFEHWLQQEKVLAPGQGWEVSLLQAYGGDHERAIHALLGFAEAFRSRETPRE
jgi:hypothetical protein